MRGGTIKEQIAALRWLDEDAGYPGYSDEYYLQQIAELEIIECEKDEADRKEKEAERKREETERRLLLEKQAREQESKQLKKDIETVKQVLSYYEQNSLTYEALTGSALYESILRVGRKSASNEALRITVVTRPKFDVIYKIASVIKAHKGKEQKHRIEVSDEASCAVALWLCTQAEVKTLIVEKLGSDDHFKQLIRTGSNTVLEFSDLNISEDLLIEHLNSRPEMLRVYFHGDKNVFELEALGMSHSEFIVNSVQDGNVNRVNTVLAARSDRPIIVKLSNGSFYPSMNIARANVRGINLSNQCITPEHVAVLAQLSDEQLYYFRASNCEFDSHETRDNFLAALLRNQRLTELYLENLGFVEKHLQLIKDYVETHVQLTEASRGSNPLSLATCDAINRLLDRNQRFMKWNTWLTQIAQIKNVELACEELVKLKNDFQTVSAEELYASCFDRHTDLLMQNLAAYSHYMCLEDAEITFRQQFRKLQDLFSTFGLDDKQKNEIFQNLVERVLLATNAPEEILYFLTKLSRVKRLVHHEVLASRYIEFSTNINRVAEIAFDSQVHEDYLKFAQCYIDHYQGLPNKVLDQFERDILKCLLRINPAVPQNYREAEDKIVALLRLKTQRILCVDNVASELQNALQKNLNADPTVSAMINTLEQFINQSSKVVSRKVISELTQVLTDMRAMARVDLSKKVLPSAPPQEEKGPPLDQTLPVVVSAPLVPALAIAPPVPSAPPPEAASSAGILTNNNGFGSPLHGRPAAASEFQPAAESKKKPRQRQMVLE